MNIMYLVPVLAIGGMLLYTRWAQANVRKRAAAGEAPQMFHDAYASKFDGLQSGERLIGMWLGLAYVAPTNTVGQIAGKLAKEAALSMVGLAAYTPTVYVGLTTHGRVLVSEEYTDMGKRNNFKVVCTFPPGSHVLAGPEAKPDHQGAPPTNTHSREAPLELLRLVGPSEQYLCWLNGAGALTGAATFVSLTGVLPMTAERAAGIWQKASQPSAA